MSLKPWDVSLLDFDIDDLVKKTNSSMMSRTNSVSFGAKTKNAAGFVAILLSKTGNLWDTAREKWTLCIHECN